MRQEHFLLWPVPSLARQEAEPGPPSWWTAGHPAPTCQVRAGPGVFCELSQRPQTRKLVPTRPLPATCVQAGRGPAFLGPWPWLGLPRSSLASVLTLGIDLGQTLVFPLPAAHLPRSPASCWESRGEQEGAPLLPVSSGAEVLLERARTQHPGPGQGCRGGVPGIGPGRRPRWGAPSAGSRLPPQGPLPRQRVGDPQGGLRAGATLRPRPAHPGDSEPVAQVPPRPVRPPRPARGHQARRPGRHRRAGGARGRGTARDGRGQQVSARPGMACFLPGRGARPPWPPRASGPETDPPGPGLSRGCGAAPGCREVYKDGGSESPRQPPFRGQGMPAPGPWGRRGAPWNGKAGGHFLGLQPREVC